MNNKIQKNKGFTLIELLTATSIFLVIMTISMGSILTVFDINRKSRAMKNAITNVNVVLESMSKEMRYGRFYGCGPGTGAVVPDISTYVGQNCSLTSGSGFLRFVSSDNELITYRFNAQRIERRVGSGGWIFATSPEVIVNSVTFDVKGETDVPPNDTLQPKVLIKIRATAGTGGDETEFTLQTIISQRAFSS